MESTKQPEPKTVDAADFDDINVSSTKKKKNEEGNDPPKRTLDESSQEDGGAKKLKAADDGDDDDDNDDHAGQGDEGDKKNKAEERETRGEHDDCSDEDDDHDLNGAEILMVQLTVTNQSYMTIGIDDLQIRTMGRPNGVPMGSFLNDIFPWQQQTFFSYLYKNKGPIQVNETIQIEAHTYSIDKNYVLLNSYGGSICLRNAGIPKHNEHNMTGRPSTCNLYIKMKGEHVIIEDIRECHSYASLEQCDCELAA